MPRLTRRPLTFLLSSRRHQKARDDALIAAAAVRPRIRVLSQARFTGTRDFRDPTHTQLDSSGTRSFHTPNELSVKSLPGLSELSSVVLAYTTVYVAEPICARCARAIFCIIQ